ncbi:MAG: cation:proton antiporter, partial [Acholeplasmataceae bacterium]
MFTVLAADVTSYRFILLLSIMLIVGLFAGRFFGRKRIPNLTGYIIVGFSFGAGIVFFLDTEVIDVFNVVINIAIGFIAFSIGLELNFKKIKRRSREVIIVTFFQALFAFFLTFLALYVFLLPLHIALVVGSLAIATEPGPILLITKRYHSKGPLTDTLVPLHGVEDAITIMIFGIALSYAISMEHGGAFGFMDIITGPVFELFFSIVIAIVIGYIFMRIIRYLKYEDIEKDIVILVSSLATILISIAIANSGFHLFGYHVHLSPILLPMATGITFANLSSELAKHETERILDLFSSPILITFFTVLGAELIILVAQSIYDLDLFMIGLGTVLYIGFRLIGKLTGSYVGSKIAGSQETVRRYLGFCLLPQAQAAIGLAFLARAQLGGEPYGTMILVIVVAATIINELFGP